MACLNPKYAVDLGVQENGKHKIKFIKKTEFDELQHLRGFYRGMLMMLPCGHCVQCAQDYARTWQLRIMCEALYHERKCFITLTYRDVVRPNKDDARAFIKSLRNMYGNGIKFFLCGELGSHTKRFHLHAILFGVDFREDRQISGKRGLNLVYSSKTLDKLWNKGFTSIGELDVASAGYVSKYCDKKKISRQDDGEFIIMSRGLGRKYFEEHREEIFNSDYLYFEGNKFKIPRYFLKLADQDGFYMQFLADDLRDRKRKVAQSFRYDAQRSVNFEEQGIIQQNDIALANYKEKESYRDVDIY